MPNNFTDVNPLFAQSINCSSASVNTQSKLSNIQSNSTGQLEPIRLNENESERLRTAIDLVSAHKNTGRANPKYFTFKLISRLIMREQGWCRMSLKNMGALMRQTGYSKNLSERQLSRITKSLIDAELITRYRDPKNDRYTYELTELGRLLYYYLNADKRSFPRIVIHRPPDPGKPPEKKCPVQIRKNVRSDSLYMKGKIKVKKDIYENVDVHKLNSVPSCKRYFHSLRELGISSASAQWLCEHIEQQKMSFETFDRARKVFIDKSRAGKVNSPTAYFKRLLTQVHERHESERREQDAVEQKRLESERAQVFMSSKPSVKPLEPISIQERAHRATKEKLAASTLTEPQKAQLYDIYYNQQIRILQGTTI